MARGAIRLLRRLSRARGSHVEVFSSRDASPQWLRNTKWFRDFVGARRPHSELLDPVLDAVRQAGSLRLRDLIGLSWRDQGSHLVVGRQPRNLGRLAVLASLRARLHVAPRDQGRTHQASVHSFGRTHGARSSGPYFL